MGYERYPRGNDPRRGNDGERARQGDGTGRSRGGMGDFRDYDAAGESGDRYTGQGQRDFFGQRDAFYGQRDYGNQRYAQRDHQYGDRGAGGGGAPSGRDGYGYRGAYQAREEQRDRDNGYTQPPAFEGRYGSDGRRFDNDGNRQRGGAYGGQPQGDDHEERGFLQRAGDEVRSWFGDDEAERRRDLDAHHDDRNYGGFRQHHDRDYHSWRLSQIDALDRDYDEYRNENRSRFENEFATWRTARQGQRDSLLKVAEHMDVLGSDGEHVGTVDKVNGDTILLTKKDADAGGRHHTIPSRWIGSVDTRGVTLTKTAADAKQQWQDAESKQALFGDKSEGEPQKDGDRTTATTY